MMMAAATTRALAVEGNEDSWPDPDPRYEVLGPLASGGMGAVYRAQHRTSHEPVVIKMMRPHLVGDREGVARFEREARVLSGLSHPHVVGLRHWGRHTDGWLYQVQDLVEGTNLFDHVEAHGPLPHDSLVRVAMDVAAALDHCHERGVVHRDLKPDNIILSADGRATLIDFGIAREAGAAEASAPEGAALTQANEILGTPHWMAPEQAACRPVGPAADLYSLGAVLFYLATGELPFDGRTVVDLLHAQMFQPLELAPLSHLPQPLVDLIVDLMAKSREHRPDNAAVVVERLRRMTRSMASDVATPPAPEIISARRAPKRGSWFTTVCNLFRREEE